MKLTARIENIYDDGQEVVTTVDADVPPPGAGDLDDWAEDYLFPLTGTGREDGESAYFLEVVTCEVGGLEGLKFEWGL